MTRNSNNKPGRCGRLGLAAVAALLLGGCHGQAHGPAAQAPAQPVAAAATQYTCSMHPQIVRDGPGQCPICGMDLVPKATTSTATAEAGLTNVVQSPNAAVLAAVATVRPAASPAAMADTLTLPGVVDYDPRRSRVVAARVGGRIERLLVRTNYQPVRKGQKLLELYSPELVTAEQELIFLLGNDADNKLLVQGARQKLRLLGLTESQLRGLARTRRPEYRVAVFSPYDGYVVETAAASAALPAPASTGMSDTAPGAGGGGMGAAPAASAAAPEPAAPSAPAPLTLTEGAYVTTGQTLFQVMNTEQVWGIFQPTVAELSALRPGQQLQIRVEGRSGPPITARLELVEPEFRAGASIAAVRVYLPNPQGRLRRGVRLTATLLADAGTSSAGTYWLPRAAVVDLGTRQVAFVRRGTTFVPVAVQVGQRTASQVQVLRGLGGSDEVAANGQYLIDSEGFIQTASHHDSASSRHHE